MDKIKISTPEHIELEYELAGLGSRFIGIVIDILLQGLLLTILFIVFILSHPNVFESNPMEVFRSTFAAVIAVVSFLVTFGYFIFFESIWSGQTPGKKIAQIQVIKDTGEPITFMEALLRNLFRFIDFLPISYYVGIGFIWFHKQRKRVGDIIAHTIVVKQRPDLRPVVLPDLRVRSDIQVNVAPLNEIDYALVRDFLIVRERLKHEDRSRIATKLSLLMEKKLDINIPESDIEELLEVIALEYKSFKRSI